jgi:hypothetical protein
VRLGCLLAGVTAAAGLAACGGADQASWAEKADAVCSAARAHIAALGRPASLDEVGPAARRTARELGAAGAKLRRLERPQKDPDITRVTRGFSAAQRGLLGFADAVARGDDRAATSTLRGLERERLRWSDAANAIGMRRCASGQRMSAALDMLRRPLYAHALGDVVSDYSGAIARAYDVAAVRTPEGQHRTLDDAWQALDRLRNETETLEPPHSLARPGRAWSARLAMVEYRLLDLMNPLERRAVRQATLQRRYRLLRRAIRAEYDARRQALRGLDFSGSEAILAPEARAS